MFYFQYRDNIFDTTLVHLTERFHGKEVYLVGSMNHSTMLAQRTKKLINEVKPEAVYVMTSPTYTLFYKIIFYLVGGMK